MTSLADVLVAEGLVSAGDAASAAERAARSGTPLVQTVVSQNLVSEFDLAEALGRALDLPVVDLAGGELDEDAVRLVSIDLAERRTLIPMALDPATRVLRVAVADPLDRDGMVELERATGLSIAPMVATLSSIARAIQRYYHRSSTKVVPRPARAASSPPAPSPAAQTAEAMTPGTVPIFSLEEEASVEARLRAVLLVLEERGLLTHADYLEALRKVLGV